MELQLCPLFCMGVKLGVSHSEETIIECILEEGTG
jgi:hypothetical protein